MDEATRRVDVPAGLYARNPDCNAGHPTTPAACLTAVRPIPTKSHQLTPVGNYQPLPYILPSIALRLGSNPFDADRLARLPSAASCLVLLWLALFLLWDGSLVSLAGMLVAVSPMVLFMSAVVNPAGLEIASAIALAASILRISRVPVVPAWLWWLSGALACILCLSRTPSPLWVLIDAIILVGLVGTRGLQERLRSSGWTISPAVVLPVLGGALNRYWEHLYGSHLLAGLPSITGDLGHGVAQIHRVLREEIGVFGSLDTPLPSQMYWLWLALAVSLAIAALYVATKRERVVLLLTLAGSLAVIVIFSAVLTSGTGFDVQGRDVLPYTVMGPLLSAEILVQHRNRLPTELSQIAAVALTIVVAAIQLVSWYWNAWRQAVGIDGPHWFLPVAQWNPPAGWLPWLAIAAAGSVILVATGLRTLSRPVRILE